MPRTLLIVEDAEQCADTLEFALHGLPDIDIVAARSAEEALRLILQTPVCAMITDLQLPQMSGFELIRRVRERPDHRSVPILVLSGDSDPTTPHRLRSLGADAFFLKPYSPSAVRQKVEMLLNAMVT